MAGAVFESDGGFGGGEVILSFTVVCVGGMVLAGVHFFCTFIIGIAFLGPDLQYFKGGF